MKRSFALLCHAGILLAAARWTYSAGGFLVTGPLLVLLLDRYVFQLLPWTKPVAWRRELGVRAGSFALGAVGFYLMRLGIVPLWEAAYRGVMVSLVAFLLELLLQTAARLPARFRRVAYAGLGLSLLGLFALAVPVLAALHPLHTVPKRTPAAFGLAFENVRFVTSDGVALAGWLMPHPAPRGNVIFCHGHGRNKGHVAGLLETLHGLGLNVLAFDFRGHGDSAGHTSTFGHREVRDLTAAAAYLRRRCPGQPLFLVGVSLGAAVSLQALPQLPDVRGVWSEGAFSRLCDVVSNYFAWAPDCLRGPFVGGVTRLGWLDCGLWGPDVNPVDCLDGLAVPIYFCHARQDELVPLAAGEALYGAYTGPKWHWWVPGATHYDVRQRNRDEYLRRLRTFLEGHLAKPDGTL
jgi:alpha-beta hydrolase superfamily lysophospholipase